MKYVLTLEKFDLQKQYQKFGIDKSLQDRVEKLYPNTKDKFKLWLSRQIKQDNSILNRASDIQGIIDYVHSPFTHKVDYKLDFSLMVKKQEDWHNELAKNTNLIKEEKNKIIKDYGDGYYWVDMQTNESTEEAKLMGHCGSDYGATTLICLRFKHNTGHIEGKLTAAYNEDTKTITQLKGKGNSKPKSIYHPYIISLFLDGFVDIDKKEISSYKPELDFQFDDLTIEQMNMVFDKKPSLKFGYNKYKFINLGKEKYLNELKKDKELKEKYNKWVKWFKDNFTMETNIDKDNPQNEFFFNKNSEVRMENMHQYETFFVDYDDIWSKIKADFDYNYHYIKKLIQSMVGEVYKIRPFPTQFVLKVNYFQGWEKHSK